MLFGLKVKLAIIAIVLAVVAFVAHQFVQQQRRIGAVTALLQQEQQLHDSLHTVILAQEDSLARAHEAVQRADSAATRALRRARMAEAKFASAVRSFDSLYASASDTAMVPLHEVRIIRDKGIAAVAACQISRNSVSAVGDSLRTECAANKRRADLQEQRAISAERSLSLIRDTPPSPKGRWNFLEGVGVGAALVTVLHWLGVLKL